MDSSLSRTTTIAGDLDLAGFGLRELDIDTPYAFLDGDGSSLCVYRDPVRTAAEIERYCPADGRAYLDLANVLEAAMNVAVPYMNSIRFVPVLAISSPAQHDRRATRVGSGRWPNS